MCKIKKTVKKSLLRGSLLGTIVFAGMSYGQNTASTPKKSNASVTNAKIDTLCVYERRYEKRVAFSYHVVFKNDTHLTSYLKDTGYDEENTIYSRILKKITHQPDFKKWTYFAIDKADWPRTFENISYGKDTVTINYVTHLPRRCAGCPEYSPPMLIVYVYFIPFTEKPIKFVDVINPKEKSCVI